MARMSSAPPVPSGPGCIIRAVRRLEGWLELAWNVARQAHSKEGKDMASSLSHKRREAHFHRMFHRMAGRMRGEFFLEHVHRFSPAT